jgi:hypothetical protein
MLAMQIFNTDHKKRAQKRYWRKGESDAKIRLTSADLKKQKA